MAKYDASINLIVSGQQKVEKLLSSVDRLQSAVDSFKSTPIDLNIKNYNANLAASQRKILDANKKINSLYETRISTIDKIAKLNNRIAQKEQILASSSSSTKKYQDADKIKESSLKKRARLLEELNVLIEQSNKLSAARSGVIENQASLRSLRQQIGFARVLANSYLELGDARKYAEGKGFGSRTDLVKNETSVAQIKQQASSFELLANNARIASREFNRFTVAAQLASQKSGRAQLEQLSVLAEAFSSQGQRGIKPRFSESEIAGARKATGTLIGSYSEIAKSEAALSSYVEQLRSLQSLVPYTSNEFTALEEAIADVNKEISKIGLRGQRSSIQSLAGPATDLGSLRAFKERESYQKRVSDELTRQAGIEDRINRANLGEAQKLELRNRLEEASSALADDQLLTAQRITREIDKQRMSMERANRSQKAQTQVFGTLGTGFSPISGELPSTVTPGGQKVRNLIPGSPAARLEDAKASRESTEAAVALAKQKLKAIDQEAEELRRGTQAATALGQQKLKALEEERRRLQDETRAAVSLAQQKMREEEKAIADAWKMRGGPALPPGFGVRGGTTRGGEALGLDAPRRLRSTLASGAIVEQGLINLQRKGVDVTSELNSLQQTLNNAKREDYVITQNNLDALTEQVALAGKYVSLQKQILAGQGGSGRRSGEAGSGLEQAIESLRNARAAREKFLGGVSPAQGIDKIVREFNTGKPGKGTGANVVNALISEARTGIPKAVGAGEALGEAVEDGLNKGLEIQSPSRVAIRAMENVIDTAVNTARAGKAAVRAAVEDLFAPKLGNVLKAPLSGSVAGGQDLIEKLANFAGRTSAKPSLFRQLAQLAGPEILSSNVLPQAMQRKAFEAGKILPETRLLPLDERRLLRGNAAAPGGGLEQAITDAAIRAVSKTGAFTGPLSSVIRSQGAISSSLFAPLSQGPVGLGGTGLFSVRPQAAIGAPGSAFPFQRYQMGGAQQFPVDGPISALGGLGTRSDASRAVSESIKKYRDAVNNFWEGEDSQFSAISNIVKSSAQLGGAKLARKLTESGRGAGLSSVTDVITGEKRLGVSSAVANVSQRVSDSLLNSLEALGFTITDKFENAIDRVRNAIPSLFDSIGGMLPPGGFGGGGRAGAGGGAGDFGRRFEEAVAQGPEAVLGLKELAKPATASIKELEALSAVLKEFRAILDPTSEGFDRLERQLRETAANLDRQLERRAPDAEFLTRRFGPRGGRAVSEGLIGGAFPLLFGQGIGASVGGGLGGAAGGFAGGGLGFGLSLVGTAAGTAIDTLIQKSGELASALAKPAENFDKLKEISFISSRALEKQIEKSQEYGNEVAVATAIQEEAIAKLGLNGVGNLSNLEKQSDRANRAFAELSQQMQAVVAGPVSGVKAFFADIAERAAAGGRVKNLRAGLSSADRQQFESDLLARAKDAGIQRGFFAGGELSQAEIGVLAEQNQLQDILDKWTDVTIKGKIRITNEQELRTQLNALEKYTESQQSRLSVFEIPKGIFDQIKSASRQQEDLDRQRFDLIESYERSVSDIRLSVEKQITQERLSNVQKENEALKVQGDIRLQQLKNANIDLKQSLFGNEFGQQLSQIVSSFTEQQLSAENEIANRRRNLEFELQQKAVQVEDFKAGIAKQIADLNFNTEKQVSQLKLSTLRQSQDYDQKRFELEKQISITKLRYELVIAKQKRAETIEQLKIEKDPGRIDTLSKQAQIYTDLGRQIPGFINQIQRASAPAKISFAAPSLGGSVSTAGFDSVIQKGKQLSSQISSLQDEFDLLAGQGNVKQFNFELNQLADQGVAQLLNEFEQLKRTLNNGDDFTFAADQIGNAFSKILESKGVTESVLSEPLSALIRSYQYLALENQKLANSLEFFNNIAKDHAEKIKSIKSEINSLLAGTTEYEKTLFELRVRGIQPTSEEFQRLVASAQQVDRLNQKLEVLNALKGAASELSGSIRGLIDDLVELGDASQAAVNFTERLGKKSFAFILDIAFKPLEKTIQDSFVQFAGKLGFDIRPEEQKQLESIESIRQSVDLIQKDITAFVAKIPQVATRAGLTDTQKQLFRDAVDYQMNAAPGGQKQPSGGAVTAEEIPTSAKALQVIPYAETQKAVENMNKVGESTKQLSEKTAVAAVQIDSSSSQVSNAIQTSTQQVNSVIPAWGASLGKVVTGLAGAVAGVTAISGGITQMQGGGTYQTLTGLASIFGGIASVAGAFGSLSSLGSAAKGFTGGYFDPMTGLGAAGPNFGFAKGGMFTNSIVSSPTLFKFANGGISRTGLMGEAGPEAIIPLSRGADGRLGVDATGFSDAISEARDALDEASDAMAQGDGATGLELSGGASDGYGAMGLKSGEAQGKMSRATAMAISDSRGAVEMIKRITQENDAKAAAAAASASPETRELYKLLATKDSNTIREITNNQVGSADGTDQFAASSQQQLAYGDAISAARGVLASEISGGEPDQMQQVGEAGAITNSREFIEKITDRISSPDSSKKAEASAFGDSRNAVGKSSGSQSAISTKETISALMQARDSRETSSAISQTREVLSSVSSMNKEKNMERVMESNVTAITKPLDIKYESQMINNVEYVTVDQYQRGLAEAAERGRALTLSSLKNSVKARRQIGI